jgi:aspartate aminotransferase
MHLTAARLDRIQPSLTIAIATKARHMIAEGKNVISLSQGEPDFETPRNIKDAAIRARPARRSIPTSPARPRCARRLRISSSGIAASITSRKRSSFRPAASR